MICVVVLISAIITLLSCSDFKISMNANGAVSSVAVTTMANSSQSLSASATSTKTSSVSQTPKGTRQIAVVTAAQDETYPIKPYNDNSIPTYSWLPAGTVDYVTSPTMTIKSSVNNKSDQFVNINSGVRILQHSTDIGSTIKIYNGTLPSSNKISLASVKSDSRFSYITLNTQWKAPFQLKLLPQTYKSSSDFSISSPTFTYIDITLNYCNSATGSISFASSDIFSHGDFVKVNGTYHLKLYLKKAGKFYGWTANYNAAGQLVFQFLKPAKITPAKNAYGYSLKGVVVMLDAGHGGIDGGAIGVVNKTLEKTINLSLTKAVQADLKSIGATVVMTRNDDTYISLQKRVSGIMKSNPDIFISIHHNSNPFSSLKGFTDYYFTPFSQPLAKAIDKATAPAFGVNQGADFYPYYVTRMASNCPGILCENGFMSNKSDMSLILSSGFVNKNAAGITQGIVNYFKSIQ